MTIKCGLVTKMTLSLLLTFEITCKTLTNVIFSQAYSNLAYFPHIMYIKMILLFNRLRFIVRKDNEPSPLLTGIALKVLLLIQLISKYRLPLITKKGAIIMNVCNILAWIAILAQPQRILLIKSTSVTFVVMAIMHCFSNSWNCC